MKRWIPLLVFSVLTLAGCAKLYSARSDRAAPTSTPSIRPDIPSIDWMNPLGKTSASVGAVSGELNFTPQAPANLGNPVTISVSDPQAIDPADRAIAWVYNSPSYGQFFVEERLPTMNQQQLEDLATCHAGETGCNTTGWSLVSIRGGITALLIYAPPGRAAATSLVWLEGNLEYLVMGPRNTLSGQQELDIAANI
jgi:hypothetical protein